MIRQIRSGGPSPSLGADDGDGGGDDEIGGMNIVAEDIVAEDVAMVSAEATPEPTTQAPAQGPAQAPVSTAQPYHVQQQRKERLWPRQRRRDPSPPALPASSSSSPSSPRFQRGSASPPLPPQPPFPSSSFSATQQPPLPPAPSPRRPRPFPLRDHQQRSLSKSPPMLPSPPPSVPSVTETPKDIEQLAGDLSRQHLERSCYRNGHNDCRGSVNGNGTGFTQLNFSVADFRLRRVVGNETMANLEVDMENDNRNDDGDCIMRPPSPDISAPPSIEPQPVTLEQPSMLATSYFAPSAGPYIPASLQRIRQRQMLMAAASVRNMNLSPFQRENDPEPAEEPNATVEATTIAAARTDVDAPADGRRASDPNSGVVAAPYPQRPFHFHSQSNNEHSPSYPSCTQSIPQPPSHSRGPSASAWSAQASPFLPLSPESLAMPHLAPLHNDVPSSGYDLQGWLNSSSTVEAVPSLTTGPVDNSSGGSSSRRGSLAAGATQITTSVVATTTTNTTAIAASAAAIPANTDAPTPAATTATTTTGPRTIQTLVEDMISSGDQCNVRTPTDLPATPSPSPLPHQMLLNARRSYQRLRQQQQQQQPASTTTTRTSTYLPPPPQPDFIEPDDNPIEPFTDPAIGGPQPPVLDLEVDMNEDASARDLYPDAAPPIATAAQFTRMEMARRTLLARSAAIAAAAAAAAAAASSEHGGGTDNRTSIAGSMSSMCMDLEADLALSAAGTDDAAAAAVWLESLPSLRRASQPNGVRKLSSAAASAAVGIGPLRYRLSAEVAMRCPNLVHSKPRMRRRRPKDGVSSSSRGEGGERDSVNGAGSVASGSAAAHKERSRDKRSSRTGRPHREHSHHHHQHRDSLHHSHHHDHHYQQSQDQQPTQGQEQQQPQLQQQPQTDEQWHQSQGLQQQLEQYGYELRRQQQQELQQLRQLQGQEANQRQQRLHQLSPEEQLLAAPLDEGDSTMSATIT